MAQDLKSYDEQADEPVRVGIVGCGSVLVSYGAMLKLLAVDGRARVVAAADVVPERATYVREHFNGARFSTRYEDVVEAGDVDLVIVITSPDAHGEVSIAALEAGKHVLVEKPMAGTLEEAARIVALARERELKLVCAPHTILSNTFRVIWKRVHDGEIGKVCSARARYGEADFGRSWRFMDVPGSGPLAELGVYNIATMTGLLGPAKRVFAFAGICMPEREVRGDRWTVERPDNYQLLLDFGEGVFGSIATGYSMHGSRSGAIELWGDGGSIEMGGEDWAPDGYALLRRGNDYAWEIHPEFDRGWNWTDGLNHLVDCIRAGVEPLSTPEHAYHIQEIMRRADESAASGQAIALESTFPELQLDPASIDTQLQVWRQLAAGA